MAQMLGMQRPYTRTVCRTNSAKAVYHDTEQRPVLPLFLMRSLLAPFVALCALSCARERGHFANEMAQSATPYLARAAREPVGWQSWSRETFSLAARLDRPILLYI